MPTIKILEGVQLLVMTRPRIQSWGGWLKRAKDKITGGKGVMKLRGQGIKWIVHKYFKSIKEVKNKLTVTRGEGEGNYWGKKGKGQAKEDQ